MPDTSFLNWLGSIAIGLVWGWLCGLLSAPPKITITAASPPSGKLAARWYQWWNRQKTLQNVAQAVLWTIILAAPAVGVYLVAGWETMLIFIGVAGLAWWLHYAWREQLASHLQVEHKKGGS